MLRILSLVALLLTILPSLFYTAGMLTLDVVKWTALAGTLIWFAVTPLWMGRTSRSDANQVQI